jgi:hypothetical protein
VLVYGRPNPPRHRTMLEPPMTPLVERPPLPSFATLRPAIQKFTAHASRLENIGCVLNAGDLEFVPASRPDADQVELLARIVKYQVRPRMHALVETYLDLWAQIVEPVAPRIADQPEPFPPLKRDAEAWLRRVLAELSSTERVDDGDAR